jgi:hypothetical protein
VAHLQQHCLLLLLLRLLLQPRQTALQGVARGRLLRQVLGCACLLLLTPCCCCCVPL